MYPTTANYTRQAKSTRLRTCVLSLSMVIGLAACATDDPNRRAKSGAGIGAVLGAVIGSQIGDDNELIGAAIGALAGATVGNYQDKQRRALELALENELQQQQVNVEKLEDDVLLVRLSDNASFDFDSAELKSSFHSTLGKIAQETSRFDKTVLHVVGYTDSTGSDSYNQDLSKRRANNVAIYLRDDGVGPRRLRTEGRGEAEPRVPNTTDSNRAINRRVEIHIKPIIEGQEGLAFEPPVSTDRR